MRAAPSLESPDSATVAERWRFLTWAMIVYALLFVAHDADHIVNEAKLYELPASFWVLLPFQYAVGIGILVLLIRRDRRGPVLAAALGLIAAAGFVAVHALPFGFASYVDTDAGLLNWVLVFVPAAVALYIGIAGLRLHALLRIPDRAASATTV